MLIYLYELQYLATIFILLFKYSNETVLCSGTVTWRPDPLFCTLMSSKPCSILHRITSCKVPQHFPVLSASVSVLSELLLRVGFWCWRVWRRQRGMCCQFSITCSRIERCSWKMDASSCQHSATTNSWRWGQPCCTTDRPVRDLSSNWCFMKETLITLYNNLTFTSSLFKPQH